MSGGYRQEAYAVSLSEFGRPRELQRAGGWVLEREIPTGQGDRDVIGCYPLLACRRWSELDQDFVSLSKDCVTISFVADPFADFEPEQFGRGFDRFEPFKEHLVLDLSLPYEKTASKHHRYYARKALRTVAVEVVEDPSKHAQEWTRVYDHLINRHQIEGLRSFSPSSFEAQLKLEGMVMLRATVDGRSVAAHLWLMQDDVAYSHLAASTPEGYERNASYALYEHAIRYFSSRAAWMNLGAGAGMSGAGDDGLTRFKRGWSSGTRTAYFCGKILQPEAYRRLVADAPPEFFPAYRTVL